MSSPDRPAPTRAPCDINPGDMADMPHDDVPAYTSTPRVPRSFRHRWQPTGRSGVTTSTPTEMPCRPCHPLRHRWTGGSSPTRPIRGPRRYHGRSYRVTAGSPRARPDTSALDRTPDSRCRSDPVAQLSSSATSLPWVSSQPSTAMEVIPMSWTGRSLPPSSSRSPKNRMSSRPRSRISMSLRAP